MQDRLGAIDHQRVAGVVPPLKAHHGCGPVGQQIDNFALAFITPLGADYDYVLAHVFSQVIY